MTNEATKPLDEQQWLQRDGESNLWYSRFDSFLTQGPTRSVRETYRLEKHAEKSKSVPASWTEAYHTWQWKSRAEAYDAWQRKVLFAKGNASDVYRVKKLDALMDKLYNRVEAMLDNAIPEETFNEKLIASYVQVVDVMAKHTGGYVERHEHTGKDGGAIEVETGVTHKVIFYMPDVEALPSDPVTIIEEAQETKEALNEL